MHQEPASKPRRRRRTYTPQFKTDLVAQCMDPSVSLAAVAIEHDINLDSDNYVERSTTIILSG
ncbi:MAG: transposase [Rubrivivax sp.]|nr:transposase [Rubrivivax sp.]